MMLITVAPSAYTLCEYSDCLRLQSRETRWQGRASLFELRTMIERQIKMLFGAVRRVYERGPEVQGRMSP